MERQANMPGNTFMAILNSLLQVMGACEVVSRECE